MPLPGGASDKAGNSYERRWTVLKITDLLERGDGSIRIEVPGDVGLGAEFRLTKGTTLEWHQVKRQRAEGNWSINALRTSGVLGPWWPKLVAGDVCYFVSGVGAPELTELAERSRSSEDWSEFNTAFLSAKQPRERFNATKAAWPSATDEQCYEALRRVEVVTIDEERLTELIKYRLAACVDGEPAMVAALLAAYVDDSVHQERSSADVLAFLASHGIGRTRFDRSALASLATGLCTRFLASTRSLCIAGRQLPTLAIDEANEIFSSNAPTVVTGTAGGGKSMVLAAVVERAVSLGWPTLVLAADRIPESRTADELGTALGFGGSPATALAALAAGEDALLVLDQLDAIGVVSGRHPERLAIIESLLLEARAHPNIRIMLGCREFDLDNDRALRQTIGADATRVRVGPLEPSQVIEILEAIGVDGAPSDRELQFLRTPLNLALLAELAQAVDTPPAIPESITDLYDQFWEVKRRACSSRRHGIDQWTETIELLVDEMSTRQALAVPHAVLDPYAAQAAAMESEAVVTTLQRRTGFVHETFFDYSWSRRFVARAGRLDALLTSTEQDLFRRSQVRQLLTYERSSDPTKYLADLAWLLTSDDVRLHIKVLAMSLAASVAGPTDDEWTVVAPLVSSDGSLLADHFWSGVRSSRGWFDALDRAEAWTLWLSSNDPAIRRRTLWLLAGLSRFRSTEVADLLVSPQVVSIEPAELLNFCSYATSGLAPQLVELLQSQVANGSLDDHLPAAWNAMLDVARTQPPLAPALAAAILERAHVQFGEEALQSSDVGRQHESAISGLGVVAPEQYVRALIPVILEFASGAARPEWRTDGLVADRIWHLRHTNTHYGLDDNLLLGAQRAIEGLAQTDPVMAGEAIRMLQATNLEVAAFLCAAGFLGNPDQFADDAAEWLMTTPGALSVGYSDSPSWLSRQVIEAIAPRLHPSVRERLEATVRGYTTEWERTFKGLKGRGYTELTLLNGFGEVLSDTSRRRRDELRRKFLVDDVSPPRGVWGGVVPAPIPSARAQLMTDRQWIKAMRRYSSEGTEFKNGNLVGDAYTQAQVLDELTGQDPERFGQLYLELDESIAPAYRDAILRGLSKGEVPTELLGAVLQHTAESGDPSLHRSLVRLIESQARFEVPPVAFRLLAMIAELDPDPVEDNWNESESDGSGAFSGIEDSSLNSTRGAVARSIGPLVNNVPARLQDLAATITRLAEDRTQQVRSALARSLAAVLFVDAGAAVEWFEATLDGASDGLLGSSDVEIFIHYALRLGHEDAMMPVLDRQAASVSVRAHRHRARQLAVGSIGDESLDQLVDSCMDGTSAERTGVLDVAIQNLKSELRRTRLVELVLRGLEDQDEAVRERAGRAFYEVEHLSAGEAASLFDAAASSNDFDAVGEAALIALEDYRKPLPESSLRLCERFVQLHADEMGNIATSAAGTAMHVVRVAIRFHAQQADPSLRARCLDVIDVLVANRAHGIDEGLGAIER